MNICAIVKLKMHSIHYSKVNIYIFFFKEIAAFPTEKKVMNSLSYFVIFLILFLKRSKMFLRKNKKKWILKTDRSGQENW